MAVFMFCSFCWMAASRPGRRSGLMRMDIVVYRTMLMVVSSSELMTEVTCAEAW